MWAIVLLAFWLQAADPAADGMKALEGQRYEEAAKLFAQAVEKDKDDLGAQFHLGLSLSLLNRDTEAIAAYQKVLVLKPGLYEAQLNLGVLELRQKHYAEAAALLEEARKQKPAEYRPNYYMGEALLALGKLEEAEPPLRAALQADAKRPEAMLALGRVLARQGRVKESTTFFEGAAAADPSFKDGLLELASFHEKANNKAEAVAIYRQFPENAGARERMGVLLLQSGQAADAVAELENAVKTSPTAANRYALATAYLKAKQTDKALPLIQAAVQQEPKDVELRLTLARLLRESKNLPGAAQEFYNTAQVDPKSLPAWRELASTLFLIGNYQGTLSAFDRLRSLGEETPGQWYLRALCYDRMQLYKEALPAYEKFLSVSENKMPEEEFKARQRIRVVKKVLEKR